MTEARAPRYVPFYGDDLVAVQQTDGTIIVVFARVYDAPGLGPCSEARRIQAHVVLHKGLTSWSLWQFMTDLFHVHLLQYRTVAANLAVRTGTGARFSYHTEAVMGVSGLARSLRTLLLVLLGSTGLASLPSTARSATTILVTGNVDELDANGVCSLREAIQAANTDAAVDACPAGSGADTIVLHHGLYHLGGDDPRTQQRLEIASDLTLQGVGTAWIFGSPPYGTLSIQRGSVTIANLTIDGRHTTEGGAVRNAGTLLLRSSFLRGAACFGGAVFNDSTGILSVTDSVISQSTTFPCAAPNGAGIYNRGTMTLRNTMIMGNQVRGRPGDEVRPEFGNGGGLFNAGTATLDFVSVIDNLAEYGDGGGIMNTGALRVSNSLIARNRAAGPGQNCAGALITDGHNLIEQVGGCALSGTGPGDLLGRDAKLTPSYGDVYPPPPWLLSFGSPAIDAADPSGCPATDVWGTPRPIDGNADGHAACDIGAYELSEAHQVFWLPEITTLRR